MMKPRHFRSLHDVDASEFQAILRLAHELKAGLGRGERPPLLAGYTLALLFEKPSLRTRISFEAGLAQLGGTAIYLTHDVGWKERECVADFVRVLAEYCDGLVCRAKSHDTITELADFGCLSIINGLTDRSHPCQALADLMTMQEHCETLAGKRLVFVGDGNNVARSVLHACALAGVHFTMLGPPDYSLAQEVVQRLTDGRDVEVVQTEDAASALQRADFIYTDVWVSMGQEAEAEARRKAFADYQLNSRLLAHAPPHAKIMHCLPARRGMEITDEVIDGLQSIVIQQAGNRMHAQKGLLVWLAAQNGCLREMPENLRAMV